MIHVSEFQPVATSWRSGSALSCALRIRADAKPAKDCDKNGSLDRAAMVRFCRQIIVHGTADQLACITGRTRSAAEKWLRLETRPDADAIASLITFFGPSFIVACMPGCADWAERVARDEHKKLLKAELEKLG